MHPGLGRSCTRLLQSRRKAIATEVARFLADKSDNIQLPPEPTTCCMSGCANCVWIEYAETLSQLLEGDDDKARQIVISKISDPNLKMFLSLEIRHIQQSKADEKTT